MLLVIKRRKKAFPKHQVFLLCVSSVIPVLGSLPAAVCSPKTRLSNQEGTISNMVLMRTVWQRAWSVCAIDLCEEEEFKVLLLELKHKHDVIMKSQMRHKSSLSRRTSSTGSRGWVVLCPAGHLGTGLATQVCLQSTLRSVRTTHLSFLSEFWMAVAHLGCWKQSSFGEQLFHLEEVLILGGEMVLCWCGLRTVLSTGPNGENLPC